MNYELLTKDFRVDLSHANWVIETGEQDIKSQICQIWQECWKDHFNLEFHKKSTIMIYTSLKKETVINCRASCLFKQINSYIVCFIKPAGQYVDHTKMEEAILTACFLPSHRLIENEEFYLIINEVFKSTIEPKLNQSNVNQTLFAKTDFVVTIDGNFHLNYLEKTWKSKYKNLKWVDLGTETFNYSSNLTNKKELTICKALCQLAKIDQIFVGFISNASLLSDHHALKRIIPEWCPNAVRLMHSPNAAELLKQIYEEKLKHAL